MLFNVVLEAIVCHWLLLVASYEAVPEVLGRAIQKKLSFFYAEYGLVVSTRKEWLQE